MACTKRKFKDEIAAKIALIDIDREREHRPREAEHKQEKRTYKCPECHKWHLTKED